MRLRDTDRHPQGFAHFAAGVMQLSSLRNMRKGQRETGLLTSCPRESDTHFDGKAMQPDFYISKGRIPDYDFS